MTAEIYEFSGVTALDLDPDRVLKNCVGRLQGVVVMGYEQDGTMFFASSYADGGEVLWLIEKCKLNLLRTDETER